MIWSTASSVENENALPPCIMHVPQASQAHLHLGFVLVG
jgi:hypothetical protein